MTKKQTLHMGSNKGNPDDKDITTKMTEIMNGILLINPKWVGLKAFI
jgi:hypothetical protein